MSIAAQRSANREESYSLFRTSSGLPGFYGEDKISSALNRGHSSVREAPFCATRAKSMMTGVRCPLKVKGSDFGGALLLHGGKIKSLLYPQMLL
jgi:hypothetical protein